MKTESKIPQHTDEPIRGTADSPDLLNRTRFASQLASGILSTSVKSGFVMSIEGTWGYGKTSLINLIENELRKVPAAQRPIICSFNPWMVGNSETLIQSFLVQLAASIGLSDQAKNGEKAARELLSYSSVFSALKFIPGVEPWASIVKGVIDAVGTSTEKIADLKKLDLEKRRAAVVKALAGTGRRIVVLVDDLDRLPPAEVFAMVRLIKAVGDFPGVVYVLGFDPAYVAAALASHHIRDASEYLDKIVQTRISLPKIARDDLVAILNKELDGLPEAAKKDHFPKQSERHNELFFSGLGRLLETPRDIKRLFNRIRFVEPGCRGEVNIADLIALEAIAIKAPSVYTHIRENPAAYVGEEAGVVTTKGSKEVVQDFAEERKLALESVAGRLRESVSQLTEELFPLLSTSHVGISADRARTRGFIAAPDRLAVALSSGTPSGDVPYATAVEFLRHSAGREAVMESILKSGRLARFIEQLQFAQKENVTADPSAFADVLGKALDTPAGAAAEAEQRGLLGAGVCRSAWWLVKSVVSQLQPDKRYEVMREIVLDSTTLSLALHAISELMAQHGAFSDEPALPEKERWTSTSEVEKLTDEWATMVAAMLQSGRAFAATDCGLLVSRLKLFRPDLFKALLPNLVQNDADFDRFFCAVAPRGTDSKHGRFVLFSDEDLEDYGGVEQLRKRARTRLTDSEVTSELRSIYTAIVTGKKQYLAADSEFAAG